MSHVFYLVSVDTRRALDLGKIVNRDESDTPIPLQFGSWIDCDSRDRIPKPTLNSMIATFLIRHVGKKVAVVPEEWMVAIDPDGCWEYYDSVNDFIQKVERLEFDDSIDEAPVPNWLMADASSS